MVFFLNEYANINEIIFKSNSLFVRFNFYFFKENRLLFVNELNINNIC